MPGTIKGIWKDQEKILKDEKGQADVIGNIITLLTGHPWVAATIFFAIIYASTFSIEIAGVDFGLYTVVNGLFAGIAGSFGVGFDYRLLVIGLFLSIGVIFILSGDKW